jgi:hypothetical protein
VKFAGDIFNLYGFPIKTGTRSPPGPRGDDKMGEAIFKDSGFQSTAADWNDKRRMTRRREPSFALTLLPVTRNLLPLFALCLEKALALNRLRFALSIRSYQFDQ